MKRILDWIKEHHTGPKSGCMVSYGQVARELTSLLSEKMIEDE